MRRMLGRQRTRRVLPTTSNARCGAQRCLLRTRSKTAGGDAMTAAGESHGGGNMSRLLAVVYGLVVYVFFLATFLYAIGFVGNLLVRQSIDSGPAAPLTRALIV